MTFILPMGPQHPFVHEPEHFRFEVEGEEIVDVDIRLGYCHRGIERALQERNYRYNVYLVERVCGICNIAHTTAYCQTIERLAGVEVPDRARYIRTILLELERIHSHLLWAGVAAHEIGFLTLFMYCVSPDTKLIFSNGEVIRMDELFSKSPIPNKQSVHAWNGHHLSRYPVLAIQRRQAPPRLTEIKTRTGFSVKLTPDHKVLVDGPEGPIWVEAKDVKKGDLLFEPKRLELGPSKPPFWIDLLPNETRVCDEVLKKRFAAALRQKEGSLKQACNKYRLREYVFSQKLKWPTINELQSVCTILNMDWEKTKQQIRKIAPPLRGKPVELFDPKLNTEVLYLLGLLASDGTFALWNVKSGKKKYPVKVVQFINCEKELLQSYAKTYQKIFGRTLHKTRVAGGHGLRYVAYNPVLWLIAHSLGLIDRKGRKSDMLGLLKLPKPLVASFLTGYFDGDGYVRTYHKHGVEVSVPTKNRERAINFALLLKRFGISSIIRKDRSMQVYRVSIKDSDNAKKFAKIVNPQHPRKRRIFEKVRKLSTLSGRGNFNLLSNEVKRILKEICNRYSIFPSHIDKNLPRALTPPHRITRMYLQKIIKKIFALFPHCEETEKLSSILNSDFKLVRVADVRTIPCRDNFVYDITVASAHNFTPNFAFVISNCWRDRELVMDLRELISGNRVTSATNALGGVRRDIRPEHVPKIKRALNELERRTKHYAEIFTSDRTILARCLNIGVLTKQDALALCAVGPTARASDVRRDIRADDPYAAYGEIPFEVVVEREGDVLAKTVVRLREILESINIIRHALDVMPAGPLRVRVPAQVPPNEMVGRIEAPRGELFYYAISNGTEKPERVRIRTPTYANIPSMRATFVGGTIAEIPIVLASIDPCFSCTDRVTLIDRRRGDSKVVTLEELRRWR